MIKIKRRAPIQGTGNAASQVQVSSLLQHRAPTPTPMPMSNAVGFRLDLDRRLAPLTTPRERIERLRCTPGRFLEAMGARLAGQSGDGTKAWWDVPVDFAEVASVAEMVDLVAHYRVTSTLMSDGSASHVLAAQWRGVRLEMGPEMTGEGLRLACAAMETAVRRLGADVSVRPGDACAEPPF